MSTNSTISIKRKDGTETSIYCHWNGYIEGVGVTLQLAYNTPEKLEKLLALGDLSVLGYYTEPDNSKEHNFECYQKGVCLAYHRDRGGDFCQSGGMNEYNYIFDEQECVWYVEKECYEKPKSYSDLHIDYVVSYKKMLLLDAIIESDIENCWQDNEFAKAGEVIDNCKKKAIEARKEIIENKIREEKAFYKAYCD